MSWAASSAPSRCVNTRPASTVGSHTHRSSTNCLTGHSVSSRTSSSTVSGSAPPLSRSRRAMSSSCNGPCSARILARVRVASNASATATTLCHVRVCHGSAREPRGHAEFVEPSRHWLKWTPMTRNRVAVIGARSARNSAPANHRRPRPHHRVHRRHRRATVDPRRSPRGRYLNAPSAPHRVRRTHRGARAARVQARPPRPSLVHKHSQNKNGGSMRIHRLAWSEPLSLVAGTGFEPTTSGL